MFSEELSSEEEEGYKINVLQFLRILKEKRLQVILKNTWVKRTLIFPQSIKDHEAIFALIKEKRLHATMSTPPILRPQSLVICGLHRQANHG